MIGDSQVTATSWVGLGLKQAGFVPYMFRCGGIGFVTARDGVPLPLSGCDGWPLGSAER